MSWSGVIFPENRHGVRPVFHSFLSVCSAVVVEETVLYIPAFSVTTSVDFYEPLAVCKDFSLFHFSVKAIIIHVILVT